MGVFSKEMRIATTLSLLAAGCGSGQGYQTSEFNPLKLRITPRSMPAWSFDVQT